jgi:tRNA(Ile)-lysidine synthase
MVPGPDSALLDRFRIDLDALIAPDEPVGIAVSGGPDSLALLLLAAAARPGKVEAATVDHALRSEARAEAEMVAALCQRLAVPHQILTARWDCEPSTAIQERSRGERYRLLGYWAEERALSALATAHHADDQAETLLMRLARGAGVRGLAAMRSSAVVPGAHVGLVRPLLGWRRAELERVCAEAALSPADDRSNRDERFERVRIRQALAGADWLDPAAIARSAANLADADEALRWAVAIEWGRAVEEKGGAISYRPTDAPSEIVRRIVSRAVRKLATEGESELRGAELGRLVATLGEGGTRTLRGLSCSGGRLWKFSKAPPRRA